MNLWNVIKKNLERIKEKFFGGMDLVKKEKFKMIVGFLFWNVFGDFFFYIVIVGFCVFVVLLIGLFL